MKAASSPSLVSAAGKHTKKQKKKNSQARKETEGEKKRYISCSTLIGTFRQSKGNRAKQTKERKSDNRY
jgi:hypothetical protein